MVSPPGNAPQHAGDRDAEPVAVPGLGQLVAERQHHEHRDVHRPIPARANGTIGGSSGFGWLVTPHTVLPVITDTGR